MSATNSTSDRLALGVYALLAALSLGLLLFGDALPERAVSGAVAAVYLPLRAVTHAVDGLAGLLVERRELLAEAAQLRRYRVLLYELRDENERLRQQLDFGRRDTLHLVPAWILAKRVDRGGTRVLINRGALDGVHPGDPVIDTEGLVGRVDALEPHLARVRMLLDRSSAVSVTVQRSRVDGIVEGDPLEGLRMRFVSYSADVKVGDEIVTSGLGGTFPRGLPVGTVRAVGVENGGLLRRIEVEPAASPERAEDVFVLSAPDTSQGWGFLWARPRPPTDSLAESVRSGRLEP